MCPDDVNLIVERVPHVPGVVGGEELGFYLDIREDDLDLARADDAGRSLGTIRANVAGFELGASEPSFSGRGGIMVTDRLIMGCLTTEARSEIDELAEMITTCDEEWLDEIVLFSLRGDAVQRLVRGLKRRWLRPSVVLLQLEFPGCNPEEVVRLHLDWFESGAHQFADAAVQGVGLARLAATAESESDDSQRIAQILRQAPWKSLTKRNGVHYEELLVVEAHAPSAV